MTAEQDKPNLPDDGVPPVSMRDFMRNPDLLSNPETLSALMHDPDSWIDDFTAIALLEIIRGAISSEQTPSPDVAACINNLLTLTSEPREDGSLPYHATAAMRTLTQMVQNGTTGPFWEGLSDETRSAIIVHATLS